jgi:membrane-associated phospholipid phosphatase
MLAEILELDWFLFKIINNSLSNPIFDFLMPLFREKKFWIPLYLLLAFLIIQKFKYQSVAIFFLILFTVLLCDQLSSELIKNIFQRLRPCNDPELNDEVRLLVKCGSGYSFTSSHACNHFGLATLFVFAMKPLLKKSSWNFSMLRFVFYFWAGIIAFAQIYVGVHFPMDVFAGALLGCLTGFICIRLYLLLVRKFYPDWILT